MTAHPLVSPGTALALMAALQLALAAPARATVLAAWSGSLDLRCATTHTERPCASPALKRNLAGFNRSGAQIGGSDGAVNIYYTKDQGESQEVMHVLKEDWQVMAASGLLRAASFSSYALSGSPVNYGAPTARADVHAEYMDELHITSPGARSVTLHFSFNGVLSDLKTLTQPDGLYIYPDGMATADFRVDIGHERGTPVTVAQSAPGSLELADMVRTNRFRQLGDRTPNSQGLDYVFTVRDGSILDLRAQLDVTSTMSAFADFSHTATLDYILAPADVNIGSGSGTLLRQGDRLVYSAVTSAVPEPSAAVLLLTGLGGLAWRRRCWPQRAAALICTSTLASAAGNSRSRALMWNGPAPVAGARYRAE